jgi:hypothetical protein
MDAFGTIGPLLAEYGLPGAVILWLLWDRKELTRSRDEYVAKLFARSDDDASRHAKVVLAIERILMILQDRKDN